MSARPPATRDAIEFSGGRFCFLVMSAGSPPLEGSATKANPAKAGDAKPRGYRTPFRCHASRVAELFEGGLCVLPPHNNQAPCCIAPRGAQVRSSNEGEGFL